jgi:branched-chain amino acid aminotransferase
MIWLNGNIRPAEGALSANNRGFLLGEAVFETMLVKQGVPQFWQAHLARLDAACTVFGFSKPYDTSALKNALVDLLEQEKPLGDTILRLTVSAGNGGRGLVSDNSGEAIWMMQISDAPRPPDEMSLHMSDIIVPVHTPSAAHKTTGYLDNIMARRAALAVGADEALLCNAQGRVCGTAAGTLYVQMGKQLSIPPLSEGALPGIIRQALLAQKTISGIELNEGLIDTQLLNRADALFVSNSVMQVVPAYLAKQGDAPHAGQKKQGRAMCEALPQFSDY